MMHEELKKMKAIKKTLSYGFTLLLLGEIMNIWNYQTIILLPHLLFIYFLGGSVRLGKTSSSKPKPRPNSTLNRLKVTPPQ